MFRVSDPARVSRRKGFVPGMALALALTAAGAGFAAPAQAQSEKPAYSKDFAKPAQKASEDLNTVRNKPEVVAEINNLVAASNALSAAKGDAAISAAQAQFDTVAKRIQGMTVAERQEVEGLVPKATGPDDKYFAGELINFLGTFTGDRELRMKGLKLKLDSGTLKPEAVAPGWMELGQLYFGQRRNDEARAAFDAAYKAGDTQGALFATETYFSANRVAEGLDYLEGLITARTVAGQAVPQEWYGTGLTRARDLRDGTRIGHWAGLYAARGNTPESWNAAISLVTQAQQYGPQEQLDAYRLMDRAGALATEGAYTGYINAALGPAGVAYPGEVIRIATAAKASGKIVTNGPFVDSALQKAQALVQSDKASLAGDAAAARKAASGEDALGAGDAYLSYSMAPEAEEMFKLALSKGGVDNDRVLTRLAIAEVDQGKYDDARANLAKITGARAPLAAMWLAYIDTKAGRGG
jgi:tetratricopeptide (TPR) repeat protein